MRSSCPRFEVVSIPQAGLPAESERSVARCACQAGPLLRLAPAIGLGRLVRRSAAGRFPDRPWGALGPPLVQPVGRPFLQVLLAPRLVLGPSGA